MQDFHEFEPLDGNSNCGISIRSGWIKFQEKQATLFTRAVVYSLFILIIPYF